MDFPREQTKKYAYLVASTAGGLPSALSDAVIHIKIWSRLGFQVTLFLDAKDTAQFRKRCELKVTIESDLATLKDRLQVHATTKEPTDLVLVFGSHGEVGARQISGTPQQKIVFDEKTYSNFELGSWITPLQENTKVRLLGLIDTCHSGYMLDLSKRGLSLPKGVQVCSISACDHLQMDSDDISDDFGFGGGLTTKVADFLHGVTSSFSVQELYDYCRGQLKTVHPQLSWME